MYRRYEYVGPPDILAAVQGDVPGQVITTPTDLQVWIDSNAQAIDDWGHIIATYVIDRGGSLRLAPRRSEHVACAGGGPVLAAGEIFLAEAAESWHVDEISNQSTGFCPDVTCWPAVEAALDEIPLDHPGRFTRAFVFRLCPKCRERNLVKDDWFVCELCGAPLPDAWNFATVGGE